MESVSAIPHLDHIAGSILRKFRRALCQQICLLVLVAQESRSRRIPLHEHHVAHSPEACCMPCAHEAIYARPPVKAGEEAIWFQHAIELTKGWQHPGIVLIILDRTVCAITVADQVRRIGEHKINALGTHGSHDFDAVTVDDGVDRGLILDGSCSLHDIDLLVCPGVISRDTQPGGTRERAAPKDGEWLFRRCRLRRNRNRRRLPERTTTNPQRSIEGSGRQSRDSPSAGRRPVLSRGERERGEGRTWINCRKWSEKNASCSHIPRSYETDHSPMVRV